MTNVVVNNLNNMDEMLLSGAKIQNSQEKSVGGMDKSTDFDAIFDKSIDKVQEKISQTVQEKTEKSGIKDLVLNFELLEKFKDGNKTLDDLKQTSIEDIAVTPIDWVNFKDILKEITDETNVETSLDLTLARDINEIISQLKEAIETVSEIIQQKIWQVL